MSDGMREGPGEPLDEWDADEAGEEEASARASRLGAVATRIKATVGALPWSKLSWVGLAIVCGVATSLLTQPQG
jgi:hypothetical protein